MATIAMTIISSMRVKPRRVRSRPGLPFRIGCSIARLLRTLGVHIENILPTPGLRLRLVAGAALAPIEGVGHGVLGDAPQKFNLLIDRPRGFHALYQLLQGFRIV